MQLRSRGEPIKLERRPLDLLVLLVSRHGSMVGREEIMAALWPANVIIDFESGLNTLVRKVRNALDDSPDDSKFVENGAGPRLSFRRRRYRRGDGSEQRATARRAEYEHCARHRRPDIARPETRHYAAAGTGLAIVGGRNVACADWRDSCSRAASRRNL